MNEEHTVGMGCIVFAISVFVGSTLGSMINPWMCLNSVIFGVSFLLACIIMRNDLETYCISGIFMIIVSSVGICLISILPMVLLPVDVKTTQLEVDTIHRSPELGNRLTVSIDDNVWTTIDGTLWILDDSDIVVHEKQDHNLYGYKVNNPYTSIGKRFEIAIESEVTEVEEL